MADKWTKHRAPDGRIYFFNKETSVSTWTKPDGFEESSTEKETKNESESVWEERFDPKSGRNFYYNRNSRVSTWTKPTNAIVKPYVAKVAATTSQETKNLQEKSKQPSPKHEAVLDNVQDKSSEPIVTHTSALDSTVTPQDDSTVKTTTDNLNVEQHITKSVDDTYSRENTIVEDEELKPSSSIEQSHSEESPEPHLEALRKKDAIMDLEVMTTIEKFLKASSGDEEAPVLVVKTLSESYRGYAQMAMLVSSWLDMVSDPDPYKNKNKMGPISTETEDLWSSSNHLVQSHLKSTIIQRYQPKLLKQVLDAAKEPQWLEKMLRSKSWRMMLIELADTHKSCGLLNYAVQRISEAGHHKEIASVTSATTYFSVFNGVLVDALQRIRTDGPVDLAEDLVSLKKICSYSAYTHMYAQELLNYIDSYINKTQYSGGVRQEGEQMSETCSKYRRIRQELQLHVYSVDKSKFTPFHILKRQDIVGSFPLLSKSLMEMLSTHSCSASNLSILRQLYDSDNPPPVVHLRDPTILGLFVDCLFHPYDSISETQKEDCLVLLSYVVCTNDNRDLYDTNPIMDAITAEEEIEEVKSTLLIVSDMCKSDKTLGFNIDQSGVVQQFMSMMHIPVVSMGILHWIDVAIKLIRCAVDNHRLQWPITFSILVESLRPHTDLNPVKALELKRNILRTMVHMMTCGYVLPVLRYIDDSTEELDQALLRNFIGFVMERASPPFSREFASAMTKLFSTGKIQNALRSSTKETREPLLAFINYCLSGDDFLSPEDNEILGNLEKLVK